MSFHDLLRECNVDSEGLFERFAGNEALAQKCVVMFGSDRAFDELEAAAEASDFQAALRAAHTLKGVSGNLGMTRLFELCSTLVDDIRKNGGDKPGVAEKAEKIKKEREKLMSAISRLERGEL